MGGLIFNVLANDPKKAALYYLDNATVADLLQEDVPGVAELSALGNFVRITSDGKVAYDAGPNNSLIRGLAEQLVVGVRPSGEKIGRADRVGLIVMPVGQDYDRTGKHWTIVVADDGHSPRPGARRTMVVGHLPVARLGRGLALAERLAPPTS